MVLCTTTLVLVNYLCFVDLMGLIGFDAFMFFTNISMPYEKKKQSFHDTF